MYTKNTVSVNFEGEIKENTANFFARSLVTAHVYSKNVQDIKIASACWVNQTSFFIIYSRRNAQNKAQDVFTKTT